MKQHFAACMARIQHDMANEVSVESHLLSRF